jgi:hypothetical protein
MKVCSVCKRDDVEFGKNKTKKDGLQVQCKNCQSQTSAKHYNANKEKQLERIYERRHQLRQAIFDYLKEHPCVDCGETDPIVLEFDHLDNKKMNVSKMVHDGFSLENILLEISKCEVCCSNCHARRTAKQFGWYKDLI